MAPTRPAPNSHCPACGEALRCGAVAGDDSCWCQALPPLEEARSGLPELPTACLCERCLRRRIEDEEAAGSPD